MKIDGVNNGIVKLTIGQTNSLALKDINKKVGTTNNWVLDNTNDRASRINVKAWTIRNYIDKVIILNSLSTWMPKLEKQGR